ncbi:hypothetical protein Taro_033942, partial [Colocasia esculenta]|nr:hypothetical protein [Colocasia esculenta]
RGRGLVELGVAGQGKGRGKGEDMVNWELKGCCKHDQVVFLATIGVFTVAILAVCLSISLGSFPLWRTFLLTPFKLITVFLHETSHALACKLTCGQVEGIRVQADEGGVTETRGGIYWVILPAGLVTQRTLYWSFLTWFLIHADIYDDLISRRVHSSDAEKFAEICPCPCNGVAWGVIWGFISFIFLCGSMYLGLVILS